MSNKIPETSGSEEVDLGQLFKLIGNAFDRLFKFIGSILNSLLQAFVWLVFFIQKHILKIVIAGIVGFGFGFLKKKISSPLYESSMTLKQNYNSGENLYETIDYFNSLVIEKDSIALKRFLGFPQSQVNNLIEFELEPLTDENSKLKKYNTYIKDLDSSLMATIDYKAYVENIRGQDFKFQRIIIKTRQPMDLSTVFNNITQSLNSMSFFKREQEKDLNQLLNRENAIRQSLKESEALQITYKKVLEQIEEKEKGGQTSITIEGSSKANETKEFELFKNDLVLRRELVAIEREKENKKEIVEVISNQFNSSIMDNSVELFGIKIGRTMFYTFSLAFLAFLFLLGMELMKFLERFKNKL